MKSFGALVVCALVVCGRIRAQQFVDQTAARLPVAAVWSEEVDAADVDGDGDLDIIWGRGDGFASAGTGRQSLLLINNGSGVFADQTATRLPVLLENTKDVDFVDVDGDGDFDLVFANAFGHLPRLFLNNGSGVFTDVTSTNLPGIPLNSFGCAAGDVDNDGDLDLVFTDSGPTTFTAPGGQPRIYRNDGTGHFTDVTTSSMPAVLMSACTDVNFADVDGDFDLDLFVVSRDGQSKLFINDGAGHFTERVLPPDGSGTYDYAIGDLDGDNDADVFVVGVSGLNEGVFRNDGLGNFTDVSGASVLGNANSDDNQATLGDIDNDGDWDVAVAALTTAERILVNNGAGVFTYNSALVTSFIDSSLDCEFADIDNDGDLDLLTAVGESGAFQNRVYVNNGVTDTRAPVLTIQTPPSSTPWGLVPVRVSIRDIRASDGDPEYHGVTLTYAINGGASQTVPMHWSGAQIFRGAIPGVPPGASITCHANCTDRSNNVGASATVNFSPLGIPPLSLSVTPQSGGATIVIASPGDPGAEEYLLVSAQTSAPIGAGPFVGLGVDAFNILLLPTGLPPLHDFLNAAGTQTTVIPSGAVPLGTQFDARVVLVVPGIKLSPISRILF